MAILHEMTRLAPPSFAVNPLVKLALVDQTYMQSLHYALWYTTKVLWRRAPRATDMTHRLASASDDALR